MIKKDLTQPRVPIYRHIELFETDSGRVPVMEFIESIRKRAERAKIVRVFEVIQELAVVPSTLMKKLKGPDNLWELRVAGWRFVGFIQGNRLVLVHAFDKKSMKTALRDIEIAAQRKRTYYQRETFQ